MLTPVTILDQAYLCPSWEDMGGLTVDLAQKIRQSRDKYDRVVALAKGGLSWNRQLQDLLQIENTSSIQVRFYQGIKETAKRPIIVQALPVTIENESILIFDDVADTGESLAVAKEYLNHHGAKSIKTATMFEKPWSKFKPDFNAANTDAWLIFPHDATQYMMELDIKWKVDTKLLKERFIQIGLEESMVNFYLASKERS